MGSKLRAALRTALGCSTCGQKKALKYSESYWRTQNLKRLEETWTVEKDDKKGNSEEIDDFEEMEEGKKGWWNKKRELRKVLRNDKKNLISLEEYRRRQYQKFCKEKK